MAWADLRARAAEAGRPAPALVERPARLLARVSDLGREALAAVDILLGFFPDLRIRFVNVVDLMRLQDEAADLVGKAPDLTPMETADREDELGERCYYLMRREIDAGTLSERIPVEGFCRDGERLRRQLRPRTVPARRSLPC